MIIGAALGSRAEGALKAADAFHAKVDQPDHRAES